MNYTLYIDESGDFESERGQWVISGMLFSDTYENCEKFLKSTMNTLPKELSLNSIRDFHLTEFRREYGHEKAVLMAKQTLNKLNSLPFNYHCLATINYTKSSLINREKTYRLMLADVLALCETVIPDEDRIENLDFIVASRTIDGQLQTSISNITNEIVQSLPISLEVDLATKGMVDLIGKHIKVKMDYANNSWGLVCADFLANLNYHNRKDVEKEYLNQLASEGKYSLFESFGGFEVRRANIAERDKDLVLALYRWILIYQKSQTNKQAPEAIQRLLHKVFSQRGTSGQHATFEALIERLWRNNNSISQYKQFSEMLRLLDIELEKHINTNTLQKFNTLLFRLRNMSMLVENHLGDTSRADIVATLQNNMITELASNPENFQSILDFKVHEIELSINLLKFEKSLDQAIHYHKMIQNYKEIWMLLIGEDKLINFDDSRANIKAEMALIRCEILSNEEIIDSTNEKLQQFNSILKSLTHPMDISRLNNYKIMFFLKQNKPKEAVEFCLSLYPDIISVQLNIFDLLWFLRSINDALLNENKIKIKTLKIAIDFQINSLDSNTKGHPLDLIWREVALYEFQTGNKSKALKAIQKSKNAFDLLDSPISYWLKIVLAIHEDYINSKVQNNGMYFKNFNPFNLSSTDNIIKIRHVTPY